MSEREVHAFVILDRQYELADLRSAFDAKSGGLAPLSTNLINESCLDTVWSESGWAIHLDIVSEQDAKRIAKRIQTDSGIEFPGVKNAIAVNEDPLPDDCDDRVFNALVETYDVLESQFPGCPIFDFRNNCFLEDEVPADFSQTLDRANHPDPEERCIAADELGRSTEPRAHAELLKLGNDSDSGVRMMVAITLSWMSPVPAGAKQLLNRLVNDEDADVREQASSALEQIL